MTPSNGILIRKKLVKIEENRKRGTEIKRVELENEEGGIEN